MRESLQRRLQNLEEVSGLRYTAERPRVRRQLFVMKAGCRLVPDQSESWPISSFDREKSTCRRMLCADGTLLESVFIHNESEELREEELQQWIATHPVERLGMEPLA